MVPSEVAKIASRIGLDTSPAAKSLRELGEATSYFNLRIASLKETARQGQETINNLAFATMKVIQ